MYYLYTRVPTYMFLVTLQSMFRSRSLSSATSTLQCLSFASCRRGRRKKHTKKQLMPAKDFPSPPLPRWPAGEKTPFLASLFSFLQKKNHLAQSILLLLLLWLVQGSSGSEKKKIKDLLDQHGIKKLFAR